MRALFRAALLLFLSALVPSGALALPETEAKIVHHDPLGIWERSRSFERVTRKGARVVWMPAERNFFAYYIPPGYRSGRVMVGVHGTGGNPYEELKDEIPLADAHDYMIVAVNWFLPDEGGFMRPQDVYRTLLEALAFIRKKTGNDLKSVAYIGFSRGSAISYEIAYRDAQSENVFDLFISHSGGIPRDFRVESKKADSQPDEFFRDLSQGALGADPLKGKKFFLYSGDKDEQWGTRMSDQMAHAKELIERNGGEVVEWVRSPTLGHMGFRTERSINEKAINHFVELTP